MQECVWRGRSGRAARRGSGLQAQAEDRAPAQRRRRPGGGLAADLGREQLAQRARGARRWPAPQLGLDARLTPEVDGRARAVEHLLDRLATLDAAGELMQAADVLGE